MESIPASGDRFLLGSVMTAKSFWLKEIARHTEQDGNVLTFRSLWKGNFEVSALEIKFADGNGCVLVGAEQTDAAFDYNLPKGFCTQAFIDDECLRWQEQTVDAYTPRDRSTGKMDFDAEFLGLAQIAVVRRLDDIVGIRTYALGKAG